MFWREYKSIFIGMASIPISSLGTQKVAAAMPQPSEPFRFKEIWHEIKQIAQSVKNANFF